MSLIDRPKLAQEIGVSVRTIERWDATTDAIPKIRGGGHGHKVLYDLELALAWLKSRPWMRDQSSIQTISRVCPKCHRRAGCPHRRPS